MRSKLAFLAFDAVAIPVAIGIGVALRVIPDPVQALTMDLIFGKEQLDSESEG